MTDCDHPRCRPRHAGHAGSKTDLDYSPLSGQDYFAQALAVQVNESGDNGSDSGAGPSTFRVYYTPPTRAGASQAGLDTHNKPNDEDEENPVVFVCHHGAGYSAMSFALLAKEITEGSKRSAGVLALDCRGHGA